MSAADHMGRYADVQAMLKSLLQIVQTWEPGTAPAAGELSLLEDGLAVSADELLAIAADLRAEAVQLEHNNTEALRFLEQCAGLLNKYESEAVRNGLLPAIVADRELRSRAAAHPADGFDPALFDIRADREADVTVVRERKLPPNVIPFPNSLARMLIALGTEDTGGGQ